MILSTRTKRWNMKGPFSPRNLESFDQTILYLITSGIVSEAHQTNMGCELTICAAKMTE